MKIILVFFVFFIVFLLSSPGPTPYDYFTRLANAFIHGKYYLIENPSWLSELIPDGNGKFYVPYSPGPSIVLIPFILVFGSFFQQQILAHILTAAIPILTFYISYKLKRDLRLAIWSAILISIGSILWYMGSVGSSWYLGQITAASFLFGAIWAALYKKPVWLVSTFIGISYLSRVHTIVSLPFFIFLLNRDLRNFKNLVLFFLPLILSFGFDSLYNFIRFGVFWDKAYFLLPQVLNETKMPWFIHGVMSFYYIPSNIKAAFLTFPKILQGFPYIEPSWWGLSIWITTPAFIFSLKANIKENVVKIASVTLLVILLIVFMHGGTGWAQFGYRFAVDFYPFLTFLTIKGVARTGLKKYHWILLLIGVVVNLWGVIWINKFGWVEF